MTRLNTVVRRLLLVYASSLAVLLYLTDLALPLLTAILLLSVRVGRPVPVLVGVPLFVVAECIAVHRGLWQYAGPPPYLVPGYLAPLWGIAICLVVDISDATRADQEKRYVSV